MEFQVLGNDLMGQKRLDHINKPFKVKWKTIREKPKEKSVLLRSLINKQRNITSDNRPKNPHPTFPSKENNSE